MTILQTMKWQGFNAYRLDSDVITVVVVPEIGGKIVSIYDKRSEYEWLVRAKRPLVNAVPGSSFIDYDLSGWDEMFPTISPCDYSLGAGVSVRLPDHGELWSQNWEVTGVSENAVTLQVQGMAFPYVLQRTLRLIGEASFVLEYILTNHGVVAFPFIWAAHPLFRAFPNSILDFSDVVNRVVVASHYTHELGSPGQDINYPIATTPDGQHVDLGRVGQVAYRRSRKLYIPSHQQIHAVSLSHPTCGTAMRLSWTGDVLRYFGLWLDERTHSVDYVIAPEPCTGFFDDLSMADDNGSAPVIQPHTTMSWSLRFDIFSINGSHNENHRS